MDAGVATLERARRPSRAREWLARPELGRERVPHVRESAHERSPDDDGRQAGHSPHSAKHDGLREVGGRALSGRPSSPGVCSRPRSGLGRTETDLRRWEESGMRGPGLTHSLGGVVDVPPRTSVY